MGPFFLHLLPWVELSEVNVRVTAASSRPLPEPARAPPSTEPSTTPRSKVTSRVLSERLSTILEEVLLWPVLLSVTPTNTSFKRNSSSLLRACTLVNSLLRKQGQALHRKCSSRLWDARRYHHLQR